MKNGPGAKWIGITFLILVSCAGSPEPGFNPQTGIETGFPNLPEEQTGGQVASSSEEPAESGDSETEADKQTQSGLSESEGIPAAAIPSAIDTSAPVETTEKVKKTDKGVVEGAKKPESSKPRLKGFSESAPADLTQLAPVPPGTVKSEAVEASEAASELAPLNPLLTDSQSLRPSAVRDTGEVKTGDEKTGSLTVAPPAAEGVGPGTPAKAPPAVGTSAAAPAVKGAPVSPAPAAGASAGGQSTSGSTAAALAGKGAAAPAPAAGRTPVAGEPQNSQVFTNPLIARPNTASSPLKDPAAAAAAPSRLLDSPGEFTVTLAGQGWIFRSDLSTPGSWRFLERIRKGESTGFRFLFPESGEWSLVFERQDPASGSSESQTRLVRVGNDGGTTMAANGPIPQKSVNPISGELPQDPESRNIAAEEAVAAGDFEGALEFWERDASDPGQSGRLARKAIVELASRSGSIRHLIAWLPAYIRDGADTVTLEAALKIFESQAGYDKQSMAILDVLTIADQSDRHPEWLYRQASILEKPGPDRDLDRAAMLYQQVITQWPLSSWRDLSEERLLWLKRHYFRVR